MPAVPESLFLEGVRELVRLDQNWIPQAGAGSLYIRPVLFSTEPTIRIKPTAECQFIILTFPFGSYFSAPVDVVVCERYARAFPGGTGHVKPAGNYAAGLPADQEAHEAGCDAVLWLDAQERRYVEECGVMNVFFVIGEEVVTPALSGTILPGITRDSVITLLRDMGYRVREERFAIQDVMQLHNSGQLRECFGTGTAATVTHVSKIRYRDGIIELPRVEQRTVGPLVREKLLGLMTGCQPDPYGWVELI
jgi:branched-chain amino acid aminotransferase